MSNVVQKCPKDGIEHDLAFIGTCESCFGPLQFYCKTHNQWLVDETCDKCGKSTPVPLAKPSARSDVLVIIGVVAVLGVCIAIAYFAITRLLHPKTKSDASPSPQVYTSPPPPAVMETVPSPPPMQPPADTAPVFPAYPPIEVSIADILIDPDKYLKKLVRTSGVIQVKDTENESFDLRQGDRSLQVIYRYAQADAKTRVTGASSSRLVMVTGLLRLDETYNSYYVIARDVD